MGIATSTIYGQGQSFSKSVDQGSTYLEYSYTNRIGFDSNFEVTTPIRPSLYRPTVSNYPQVDKSFFMGSFDGFWIHKIYNDGHLVMTVQGVNKDMFIPIQHDRVESVAMQSSAQETGLYSAYSSNNSVPSPSILILLVIASLFISWRTRWI